VKLKSLNLVVDIAQSEPADVALVMLKMRDALVLLLEEIEANKLPGSAPYGRLQARPPDRLRLRRR
jgi:hypothetical protein